MQIDKYEKPIILEPTSFQNAIIGYSMNSRRTKILFASLLLLAFAFYLFIELKPASRSDMKLTSNSKQFALNRPKTTNDAFGDSRQISKTSAAILDVAIRENNTETLFFGRVVDQNGESVPNAMVSGYIRHWRKSMAYIDADIVRFSKNTDSDGKFEIRDVKGDGVFLDSISRTGYQFVKPNNPKLPSVFGTKETPAVFKLWKFGKKEPLVIKTKRWKLVPDGRWYTFDLLNGERLVDNSAGGDIRIAIQRPEGVDMSQKYAWELKISAVDAGIIETHDEFMNLAPLDGYQTEYIWNLPVTDPNWTPLLNKSFYFKSRNQKHFGCVNLEVHSAYQEASAIFLNYRINPHGSPVLEP